jgi:cytoskeletal protein RodZ
LFLSLAQAPENQQILAFPRKRPRFAIGWATVAASVIIIGSVVITNREAIEHNHTSFERAASAPQSQAEQPGPPIPVLAARNTPNLQTDKITQVGAPVKSRPAEKHMTAKPQGNMQFDQSGEVHFTGNSAAGANSPAADSSANQVEHIAAAPQPSAPPQATAKQAIRVDAQASQLEARSRDAAQLPAPVWRLGSDGAPERSLDGGQNWQAASAPTGPFQAVSSVGREIWLGGNAGLLYHSSDSGQNWSKISPVTGDRKLQSDISRIDFTDALTGVVSTVNGEVWSTSDGGQSWRLK